MIAWPCRTRADAAFSLEHAIICSNTVDLQAGPQDKSDSGQYEALVVELPPVAWLQSNAMGGSLPCVVEWLPVVPHDLLLVLRPLCTCWQCCGFAAFSLYHVHLCCEARIVTCAPK